MFPNERRAERERFHHELEQNPKDGKLWYDYGSFLVMEWHDYRTAILVYKKVQTLAPKSDLICGIGDAYSRAGDHTKGLALIRAGLQDRPAEFKYSYLGMALLRARKYKQAQEAFRQAIALNPQFEEAHYFLGEALWKSGSPHKAYACYQEAIRLDKTYAPAWSALGRYLEKKTDRLEEAIRAYKKSVELEPTHAWAKQSIARILCRLGRDADAEVYFQEAIQDFPEIARFHLLYAKFLKAQGRTKDAKVERNTAPTIRKKYGENL